MGIQSWKLFFLFCFLALSVQATLKTIYDTDMEFDLDLSTAEVEQIGRK